MNIYKNFLPQKVFDTLKNAIMSDYFAWYFNDFIDYRDEKENSFQFTFTFIKNGKSNCCGEWHNVMTEVLTYIKHKKMNRVKANLLTITNKIIENEFHTDQEKGTTGILYLNNCNGYTLFKNGKKVISEENKYVEFNSSLEHKGSSCTNKKRRVVINFNYQ